MMLGIMIKFIIHNRLLLVCIKVFLKCYCINSIMEKANLLPCYAYKIKHFLVNYLIYLLFKYNILLYITYVKIHNKIKSYYSFSDNTMVQDPYNLRIWRFLWFRLTGTW
jgi:hypothetical protein